MTYLGEKCYYNTMILRFTGKTNPFYNLAAEEILFRDSREDIFMLWQNEPTVVIGKNQNMYAEVMLPYTEAEHIHVARRITGGGAVYHDLGNINYSFITSRDKAEVLDFAYFTRPIIDALKTLGLSAKLSGRNDLLIENNGEWLKFSGNAETANETRILHHGTILFDSDLTVLSKALKPDPDKLKRKGIPSVRSRVTNLRPLVEKMTGKACTTSEFFDFLVSYVESVIGSKGERIPEIDVLSSGLFDRNASYDYNAGRKKNYMYEKKCITESGIVLALWDEDSGRITDVTFEGDFFSKGDIEILKTSLRGLTREEAAGLTNSEYYLSGISSLSVFFSE